MRNRYGQMDYTHIFNANLLLEGAFGFASVGGANGQTRFPDRTFLYRRLVSATVAKASALAAAGDLANTEDRITIGGSF